MTITNTDQLPAFLQSYGNLQDHLNSQLDNLNSTDKGITFANFIRKIIPMTKFGDGFDFDDITVNQPSHDGGVDLVAQTEDRTKILYVQSKLTLRGVDDLDLVISKLEDYYRTVHASKRPQQAMLFDESATTEEPQIYFLVATLSNVRERILPIYSEKQRPSKAFFNDLKEGNRIEIIDGPSLLPIVQSAYRKSNILPSNITLHFDCGILQKDNVYIGIISAFDIKKCYDDFGEALFLDNIRDFLGITSGKIKVENRENVNEAIIETASSHPEKMLARNNGITFRAERILKIDDNTLSLENASIVNGCQTTMSIVRSPRLDSFVLAKIVEISDSWDIAKSANFQNKVEQIELELARYIRPQIVKRAASRLGVNVSDSTSIFNVFEAVYQEQVTYEEVIHLFIGLFSRNHKNIINANYTDLRSDLLETFNIQEPPFETLFMLCGATREGKDRTNLVYSHDLIRDAFQRFWKEGKSNYRSVLAILAACGCVNINIYRDQIGISGINEFLEAIRQVLENDRERFIRYYCYAFESVALEVIGSNRDIPDMLRAMYDVLRGTSFDNLFLKLQVIASGREFGRSPAENREESKPAIEQSRTHKSKRRD
jgi:hypothetical protein